MKNRTLRVWHRRVGLVLAPFLLLQGLSGLILTYGVFVRVGSKLDDEAPPLRTAWNLLMAKTHFGPGLFGWIYHSIIGIGLLWLIGSGVWMGFDLWRRKRQTRQGG